MDEATEPFLAVPATQMQPHNDALVSELRKVVWGVLQDSRPQVHGSIAAHATLSTIEDVLGMSWVKGRAMHSEVPEFKP